MGEFNPKVELSAQDGVIEIRYFDTPKDERYRSWKLPEPIANELAAWWLGLKKNGKLFFPLQKKTKVCELTMNTGKFIGVKSLDCRGRTDMTGWNLPAAVIERLVVWQKDADDK